MTCYFYTGIWTAIETSSYFIKPLADFFEWQLGNVYYNYHSVFIGRWYTIYKKM